MIPARNLNYIIYIFKNIALIMQLQNVIHIMWRAEK